MANHKSARKRAIQNEKRRTRNSNLISATKTAVKKTFDAISKATTIEEAKKALTAGERSLQKAVTKGVIKKENASRRTQRLAWALAKKFSQKKASTTGKAASAR